VARRGGAAWHAEAENTADNANVYWRNRGVAGPSPGPKVLPEYSGGAILACPVAGCDGGAPRTILGALGTDPDGPLEFATDGTDLYFHADPPDGGAALFACPVSGCPAAPQVFAPGRTFDIAVANGGVYWLAAGTSSCFALTCPAAGCASAPGCIGTSLDGGDENLQSNFVVDGAFAYWMDLFGIVSQCALPSCANQPTTLLTGITDARALAAAAGFVYVADGNPSKLGAVYQCPATGCPEGPVTLASGLSSVTAIAADASYVYWTELGDDLVQGTFVEGTGVVRRCAVSGCNGTPETFAANLTNPTAIAVGATAVYWVEEGHAGDTGRIWAAAK
jgi:hypothetical protein